jgi:hypothetical protein
MSDALERDQYGVYRCLPCRQMAVYGRWADSVPQGSSHCSDCHATFGDALAHCGLCHDSFPDTHSFRSHRINTDAEVTVCLTREETALRRSGSVSRVDL